jgi:S-DNA-T family DNA segregation ATPase FtsK/SpoIIIE
VVKGLGRLLGALLRGLLSLVTAAAHALGSACRALGSGARDLDPAHRRDGLGLLLLALALVAAGGAWWHAGRAGANVDEALTAVFGKGALLLPPLLALGAWRVLRHPDGKGGRGRLAVGWTALSLGVLGIVHVLKGAAPGDEKGGLVGFLLGDPLQQGLTAWLAVPVLLLLSLFGLLVVTATPIHQVPTGLKALRDTLLRRTPGSAGSRRRSPRTACPATRCRRWSRCAAAAPAGGWARSSSRTPPRTPRRSSSSRSPRPAGRRRAGPPRSSSRSSPRPAHRVPGPGSSCSSRRRRAATSCRRPSCWPPAPRPRPAAPPTTR